VFLSAADRLIDTYNDLGLGLVDASLVATAKQLNLAAIATAFLPTTSTGTTTPNNSSTLLLEMGL